MAVRGESDIGPGRGVVVGIGNDLRGDDAAGLLAAEEIARRTGEPLIAAGEVPENFLGAIREISPAWVLLCDAVDFGGRPGESILMRMEEDGGGFRGRADASTHRPTLSLLARYIETQIGAKVWLLGIQPESIAYGSSLSETVREGIDRAAGACAAWVGPRAESMEV